MPVSVSLGEGSFEGEFLGKNLPSGKLFTCYFPALGMFIVEAVVNPLTKKYTWKMENELEYAEFLVELSRSIERSIAA